MLENIPEWSNSDTQADDQRKLMEFGKAIGYSDEELGEIYDHRARKSHAGCHEVQRVDQWQEDH